MTAKLIRKIFVSIFFMYLFGIIFANYFGAWNFPAKTKTLPPNLIRERALVVGQVSNFAQFYEKFHKKRTKFTLKLKKINNVDLSRKNIKLFVDLNLWQNYIPDYGDVIEINAKIEEIDVKNRYETNQKYRNIYYKISENSIGNYKNIRKSDGFKEILVDTRKAVLNKILLLYQTGFPREILPAIIIGDTNFISKKTKDFVSSAGLSHIISISGMHLAIIFMIISFFFKNKKSWIFFVTILTAIWFYSLLTGFSPSCVRSAIMLTFLVVANVFGKSAFTINNLVITCFLMLVINPRQLFQISFLFSFLGVFSIIYFFDFWKNIFTSIFPKNPIKNKNQNLLKKIILYPIITLREIFFVSLAAQTLLSPFVCFYFKSLNLSSILFNLVFVPFVGIIMWLTFATVGVSYISLSFAKFLAVFNSFLLNKIFEICLALHDKFSIFIKASFDVFYLLNLVIFLLFLPILPDIKRNFRYLRLYLLCLIIFIFNMFLI